MSVETYTASDYAGLTCSKVSFYYGYEVTETGEWCFTAKYGDKEITIPFSDLDSDDMFDVDKCLKLGIGHFLNDFL